jgi:predicted ArsR family transcriptional regulator
MTDLTDTQRTILAAAAIRPGMRILPLPGHLKGGAVKKVLTALAARGLVAETAARPGESTVRDGITLVLTAAAFTALGIVAPTAETPEEEPAPKPKANPRLREGTKQAQLIAMLKAPAGATIEEIAEATGWQHHTVRGAIAGALKKRLGLDVTSEKVEARGRVYRIKR